MNKNAMSAYENAFSKFQKSNGYSFFELVENEALQKKHKENNMNIEDTDAREVQELYTRISSVKLHAK